MQFVGLFILGVSATVLIYQDLRSRLISWIMFPLILVAGIMYSLDNASFSIRGFLKNTSFNLLFLITQFIILKTVFFLRTGNRNAIADRLIGWGDILFLICCCVFFSPINFILFYCLSLIFILFVHLIVRYWSKKYRSANTVPMAGLQALFLFTYIIFGELLNISLSIDTWILKYLIDS